MADLTKEEIKFLISFLKKHSIHEDDELKYHCVACGGKSTPPEEYEKAQKIIQKLGVK